MELDMVTALLAAPVLYCLYMLLVPTPAPAQTLELSQNATIACGKGGYNALVAAELGPTGAVRGTAVSFEGVSDANVVTVAVEAAGVNYADVCLRWGLYASWNEYGGGIRPGTTPGSMGDVPGFEFAGTVAAIGSGVTGFRIGDPVFGVTMFGGYASRVEVPAHQIFKRPATLTAPQAAGLPCVALTAWFAITQQASPIARGSWVLVHSAAGGVGSFLVQIAKIKGWKVAGVVGQTHKVKSCRDLGADVVIDKQGMSSAQLWAAVEAAVPGGFQAVFDANGVATMQHSYDHLAPCGKLIVYGFHTMLPKLGGILGPREWLTMARGWWHTPRFDPLQMVPANKSVLAFNLSFLFNRRDILDEAMGQLLGWVASGELTMPKITEFALADVRKAHAAIESGSTVGKLVLLP